jgi:non-ribosomal peptide synthetase component F
MNKALTTATASTAGVGLLLASTSAKAFVPLVLGAIIGGSVLGGAVLGSAANNAANNDVVVAARSPTVVAPAPGVTVGSTTCYFTRAWNGYAWRRVQVCNNY